MSCCAGCSICFGGHSLIPLQLIAALLYQLDLLHVPRCYLTTGPLLATSAILALPVSVLGFLGLPSLAAGILWRAVPALCNGMHGPNSDRPCRPSGGVGIFEVFPPARMSQSSGCFVAVSRRRLQGRLLRSCQRQCVCQLLPKACRTFPRGSWCKGLRYRRGHSQRNRFLDRFSDPTLGPYPALGFHHSANKPASFQKHIEAPASFVMVEEQCPNLPWLRSIPHWQRSVYAQSTPQSTKAKAFLTSAFTSSSLSLAPLGWVGGAHVLDAVSLLSSRTRAPKSS